MHTSFSCVCLTHRRANILQVKHHVNWFTSRSSIASSNVHISFTLADPVQTVPPMQFIPAYHFHKYKSCSQVHIHFLHKHAVQLFKCAHPAIRRNHFWTCSKLIDWPTDWLTHSHSADWLNHSQTYSDNQSITNPHPLTQTINYQPIFTQSVKHTHSLTHIHSLNQSLDIMIDWTIWVPTNVTYDLSKQTNKKKKQKKTTTKKQKKTKKKKTTTTNNRSRKMHEK